MHLNKHLVIIMYYHKRKRSYALLLLESKDVLKKHVWLSTVTKTLPSLAFLPLLLLCAQEH